MKKFFLPILAFILASCSSNIPAPALTATPTMPPPTLTVTATLTPLPAVTFTLTPAADPNLRVEVGEGMWESPNDMTINWENGQKLELEFASPEAMKEVKNACNIAMWAAAEAGRLSEKLDAGDYSKIPPVPFDEWMKRVEANGGKMTDMYRLTAHPREIGLAQAIKISDEVDMNKCEIVLHPPGSTLATRPFDGAIALPGLWINIGAGNDGNIRISLAAMLQKNVYNFPFLKSNLTPQENAKAMSEIVALWVEDMNGLLTNKFGENLVMHGYEKKGDPIRIDINFAAVIDKYNLSTFMTAHPDAGSKWLKLKK